MPTNTATAAMRSRSVVRHLAIGSLVMSASIGCSEQDYGFVATDKRTLLTSVTVPVHSVNLALSAPYDTVRITPIVCFGDSTIADPTVAGIKYSYGASDTSVSVDSTGLVTAKYRTIEGAALTLVVVNVNYHGQTRRDSTWIRVTTSAPLGPLSLHLQLEPDSQPKTQPDCAANPLVALCNSNQPLRTPVVTATGDTLPMSVLTWSSDSLVARVDTGVIVGLRPGRTVIHAETYAYGQRLRDSIMFTVTEPAAVRVQISGALGNYSFQPDTVRVVTGGVVGWENFGTDSIDVTFENPPGLIDSVDAGPVFFFDAYLGFYEYAPPVGPTGTGNIAPWAGDRATYDLQRSFEHDFGPSLVLERNYLARALRGRRFPIAGRYPYHSERQHTRGIVIVCTDVCS